MLTAEQMLAAQKANVETLFGLTTKAFEGVEKLVELNLTASKAALTEAAETSQSVLGVKDAQELLALQAALFQPLAEKTAAYSRHLYDISTAAGAEFTKAVEGQFADAQKKFRPSWTTPPRTPRPAPRPPSPCSRAPLPPATTPWNPCRRP